MASSGIKYPADQDPVLYNIMLIRFYFKRFPAHHKQGHMPSFWAGILSITPADQDPVLDNIMLIRFSGITSPVVQDTVVYNMMPIQ